MASLNEDVFEPLTNLVFPPPPPPSCRIIDEYYGSLDLNRTHVGPLNAPSASDCSSSTQELKKTVEIGKELGFKIDLEGPILQEAMEENGEINIIQ